MPHVKVKLGRRLCEFATDEKARALSRAGNLPEYQGWTNEATFTFNLYFFQERKNYEAMGRLRRADGTINRERALRLMRYAQEHRCGFFMEQVDATDSGVVNYDEIIDNFLSEKRVGEPA